MKLRIKDGQLSYGSTYRLLVTCWICGVGSFFMAMLLLVFAVMMIVGTGEVNGEAIAGRGALIAGILPMFVLFPIVIVMHAFMFGGVLLFGMWIYRRFRTVEIVDAPEQQF